MCFSAIPGQNPGIQWVRLETPRVAAAKPQQSATSAKVTSLHQSEDLPRRSAVQSSPRMTRIPKRRY